MPAMMALALNSIAVNLGNFLLMTTVTLLLLSRSVSSEIIGLIATAETIGICWGQLSPRKFLHASRPDLFSIFVVLYPSVRAIPQPELWPVPEE